jgi:hypothetical protein
MVDWQITAKTIYCDSVKDEVTIIIKKDWSAICTGSVKYQNSNCEGPECRRVKEYREKLISEEENLT